MMHIDVRIIGRVLIILGVSSMAAAIFCAFYFSDVTASGLAPIMPFIGSFPLEQLSPIFALAGVILLGVGWILRDYALRHGE
jgi:hypothetical protein